MANFLGKLISEQGWEGNLSAQRVFTDWARIVGDEVAQHCTVVGYEDGQVEVEADSTAWATQLRLLAPRIVAKLNEELGQGSVVRLNIHGPKGPSWTKGKRTVRNARGPRDTYG
ncbi:MAG: DciA family protein [Aeromicrobium sp.]